MIDPLETFWDEAHKQQRIAALSNCAMMDIFTRHGIEKLLIAGRRVLEIGVGTCKCTEGMANSGLVVDALDISCLALTNASRFCRDVYKTDEYDSIPSNEYHLVISNDVVQHMSTADLIRQFTMVRRVLRRDGVFSFQFVSKTGVYCLDLKGQPEEFIERRQAGAIARSVSFMDDLIHDVGMVHLRCQREKKIPKNASVDATHFWLVGRDDFNGANEWE